MATNYQYTTSTNVSYSEQNYNECPFTTVIVSNTFSQRNIKFTHSIRSFNMQLVNYLPLMLRLMECTLKQSNFPTWQRTPQIRYKNQQATGEYNFVLLQL